MSDCALLDNAKPHLLVDDHGKLVIFVVKKDIKYMIHDGKIEMVK